MSNMLLKGFFPSHHFYFSIDFLGICLFFPYLRPEIFKGLTENMDHVMTSQFPPTVLAPIQQIRFFFFKIPNFRPLQILNC